MFKKVIIAILRFGGIIATASLVYAVGDSIISWLWPQENGLILFEFWEYFPRSFGLYFIFLAILGLMGLVIYLPVRRLRPLCKAGITWVHVAIGSSVSLILFGVILFLSRLNPASFLSVSSLLTFLGGGIVWVIVAIYLFPMLIALISKHTKPYVRKGISLISYLFSFLALLNLFIVILGPELIKTRGDIDRPDILVITVDTLRKDHLSAYGNEDSATPNMDALLRRGTRFDNAYCSAPWTIPSFGSFLTGYNPSVNDLNVMHPLSKDVTTLPEILSENGYRTECYNGNEFMYPELGFARGFDLYIHERDIQFLYPFRNTRVYRRLADIARAIREKTRGARTNTDFIRESCIEALEREHNQPLFLWCHFMDPHDPYQPPIRYLERDKESAEELLYRVIDGGYVLENLPALVGCYEGEIEYVDDSIGAIVEAFEQCGRDKNTLLIFFNDHGEEFFDHGQHGHGNNVYPETNDMVLGFVDPSIPVQARSSNSYVSHIDLMATILDATGIRIPEGVQGKTFYDRLTGGEPSDRAVISEYTKCGAVEYKGIRKGGYLLIKNTENDNVELYNIEDDSIASFDIAEEEPERAARLLDELEAMIEVNEIERGRFSSADDIELTERSRSLLESLGYL